MGLVRTLIHVHTDYSYDSDISLDALARFAAVHDFGCVAVTDHDTIEGARRLRSLTGIKVIVGEEVTTSEGHLIGLFLRECVRPGMSAMDTARAIRAQGGLVFVPHPFVRFDGCGLGDAAWRIAGLVDAVEVGNAQNLSGRADREAREFAALIDQPGFVGADSHMRMSIAPCHQLMRDFDGPADFLAALRSAELSPGFHPLSYFASTAFRLFRSLARLPMPAGFGANAPQDYEAIRGVAIAGTA